MSEQSVSPVVRTHKLSKRFPGVRALNCIDFELKAGEIHALVGANGAGKSTLVKIIVGADTADEGELSILGRTRVSGDAGPLHRSGITAIYQELTIVPEMTALENVFLGQTLHRAFVVRRRAMRRRFLELSGKLGISIVPEVRAGTLSVANQQMLEIMRALVADHVVFIMDEPTASLGPAERAKLFKVVHDLRSTGRSIIYISHDLDEVLKISDRISVMRGGELVSTAPTAAWTKASLVDAMVGDVRTLPARQSEKGRRKELLRIESLTVPGRVTNVSIDFLSRRDTRHRWSCGLWSDGTSSSNCRRRGKCGWWNRSGWSGARAVSYCTGSRGRRDSDFAGGSQASGRRRSPVWRG